MYTINNSISSVSILTSNLDISEIGTESKKGEAEETIKHVFENRPAIIVRIFLADLTILTVQFS